MDVEVHNSELFVELCRRGLLSDDQLRIGKAEQRRSGLPLASVLVSLGFLTESLLRDVNAELSGWLSVDLSSVLPDASALAMLTREQATRLGCVPLSCSENQVVVAMADPQDLLLRDRLSAILGAKLSNDFQLQPVLASSGEIAQCIDRFFGFDLSIDGVLQEIELGGVQAVEAADAYAHPIVRLVDAILSDAVKHGASDIHFEPEAGFLRVRYRIDGVLQQIRSFHRSCQSALTVRLKILANMDIAETRAPQDGRLSLTVAARAIEFRASTLPTLHGENIVLRILDRNRGIVTLDGLGLSTEVLQSLEIMLARPQGLILVTGPTGAGKTTTLYSMLARINTEQVNIMTMEDPVEYPQPLLRQTSLNEQARLDFASGVRAILRQDPDVILIGEIRDEQTAAIAYRAAMTGHQVYATLHANSSIAAVQRLADVGVPASLLAGNTIGIVSQRLVRRLCDHCKVSASASDQERSIVGDYKIYSAVGCENCHYQGYRGRLALIEVLRLTAELDELILAGAKASELLSVAASGGYKTLLDHAVQCVRGGESSLPEVARVIDFTNQL